MTKNKGYIICEGAGEPEKPEIITSNKGFTRIRTTLQTADTFNRNKRIYGKDLLNEGLAGEYVQERLKTHTWFGECGHPKTTDPARLLDIDQTRISHITDSIYWDQNNPSYLKGIVETANTAVGRDMKGLIEQGAKVAFSLRALGSVESVGDGKVKVVGPLRINCYDWVVHPSHRESYMDSILTESLINVSDELLTEGVLIPVSLTESQVVDFLGDTSDNFNTILENFEIDVNRSKRIILNENKRSVFVESEDNKKVIVRLEDYSRKALDSYLSEFL